MIINICRLIQHDCLMKLIDTHITQTRPCNIQQYFTAVKMFKFRLNFFIFFLFLLKTLIAGTRKNRLSEAVLTSTHNVCFRVKKKEIMYIPVNPSVTI